MFLLFLIFFFKEEAAYGVLHSYRSSGLVSFHLDYHPLYMSTNPIPLKCSSTFPSSFCSSPFVALWHLSGTQNETTAEDYLPTQVPHHAVAHPSLILLKFCRPG